MTTTDAPTAHPEPLTPVPAEERVALIDAVRALALLGILMVNMRFFAEPFVFAVFGVAGQGPLDRLASGFVHLFAEGKFYVLFSLLFGLGLSLQMERAALRSVGFRGRWARRMLVLLAFGVVHGVLIWAGDILTMYAIAGFPLLLFRNRSGRVLVAWALTLILVTTLVLGVGTALVRKAASTPEGAKKMDTTVLAEMRADGERDRRIYGSGSYREVTARRGRDYVTNVIGLGLIMGPAMFAMFLVGIWMGRRRILHEPANHQRLLRRLLTAGLLVGIPANLFALLSHRAAEATPGLVAVDLGHWLAAITATALGGPAFCFVYLSAAALAWLRPAGRRLLQAIAPAGRMPLTNYLLQSAICSLLFYGYGLGLMGRPPGAALALALTLAIYTGQLFLSRWWLARFRFGPAEWLWRTLGYGSAPPMHRAGAHPAI
jgi:uncharacterized protein